MNKKFISIILLMAIVFADISILNPQNILANDNGYSIEYNQEENSDVYVDDVQQAVSAPIAAATYAASKSGSWIKASNGKWWYKHSDGTYTKNDWEYIDGKWYHFDSNGYMQTGWLKVDGYWYHLDYDTGAMAIGWKYINGEYYYFNSSGIRQVGWLKDGNYWYHLDYETGIMTIGWKYINGEYYYFNSSGIRQVGWQKIDEYWYHLNNDNGIMDTQWKYITNGWYYFGNDGKRRIGWQKIDDKWYHFDNNGIMDTGWKYVVNGWYYFGTDGERKTGWQKINSEWDYSEWYYLDANGIMVTTPFSDDLRKYYFYDSGALCSTELLITRQRQEMTKWCWAASSVMVGTYNTNCKKTQSEIVKYVKGELVNEGGNNDNIIKAIQYSSDFTKSPKTVNSMSFDEMVDVINRNHPITMHICWISGDGHAIVGAGYDLYTESIYCIDPWENTANTYYNYSALINGTTLKTGTGYCEDMIIY